MKITKNNQKIWTNLFQAAIEFRDLAPWRWMHDSDLFGVKDPVTGEVGWCCIMGAGEQVYALGVYLGDEGWQTYQNLADTANRHVEESDQFALVIGQKMLKVEFVDRDEMDKEDLEALNKLGIKCRGANQWVQARQLNPGYLPWFMTDEQVVFMTHCLIQAAAVAKVYHEKEYYLNGGYDEQILVMQPTQTGSKITWQAEYEHEPSSVELPQRQVNRFLVSRAITSLKRSPGAICFSLDYAKSPIRPNGTETKPFFAKLGVWMQYDSGYIFGTRLFSPTELEADFDKVFVDNLTQAGLIPRHIIVNSDLAYDAVEPIAGALGIEVVFDSGLELFKEVKEAFLGRFI